MAGRGRPKGSTNKAAGGTQTRNRTAINWTLGDAVKVLSEGVDLEKVADIGKKFPILARGIAVDPVGVLAAITAPAISARKVAKMYEESLGMTSTEAAEDADIDDDEDDEEEAAPRKKKAAVTPAAPAKKRGRPKQVIEEEEDDDEDLDDLEDEDEDEAPPPKKKATTSKTKKKPVVVEEDDDEEDDDEDFFDDDDF